MELKLAALMTARRGSPDTPALMAAGNWRLAMVRTRPGIAGTYTFEVAEQKQCEVLLMAKIEEHPLRVEIEPA